MIGFLPLWMVAALWWMQRRAGMGEISGVQYTRMFVVLDVMRRCVPQCPASRVERWLAPLILTRIDRELAALEKMKAMDVTAVWSVKA